MPPQPGVFPVSGPSKPSKPPREDELHKDKKRKDLAGRLGQEMSERRNEQTLASAGIYSEPIQILHSAAVQLARRPETYDAYNLCLYPLSLERSALLGQLHVEERNALDVVDHAFHDEQERVKAEYDKGQERIRDRLLEGIEERRKRAREERDADGVMGDTALETNSRGHPTRKLRNKLGGSPPPPILPYAPAPTNSAIPVSSVPVTSAPLIDPLSLSVDQLPSPFPLPLTTSAGGPGVNGTNGKRRGKSDIKEVTQKELKSYSAMRELKEAEADNELAEIRRMQKKRRTAYTNFLKANGGER